jgi:hypothetical protein
MNISLFIKESDSPHRDDTEYKNNPHPSLRDSLPRIGGGLGRGFIFRGGDES